MMHKLQRLTGLVLMGLLVFAPISLSAQRRAFTLEELTPGGKDFLKIYPAYIPGLQQIGDGLTWYDRATNSWMWRANLKAAAQPLQVAELNLWAGTQFSEVPFPQSTGSKGAVVAFQDDKTLAIVDLSLRRRLLSLALEGREVVDMDTEGRLVVLRTPEGELQLVTAAGRVVTLAKNEGDEIVYGTSVHQREFGIEKGVFISPDARRVAFYRMDQSMVEPYPIVDYTPHKAKVKPLHYPMAGMPSHHVTLAVHDVETGQTTYMQTGGDPEHYLTCVSWAPDASKIFIAEQNRAQNHYQLNQYNPLSGSREHTLLEERSDKYVEPSHPMLFLPDGSGRFIWQSQKSGYNHLYLHDAQGKQICQLTKGEWLVSRVVAISPDAKRVYFECTASSPLETRLYTVGMDGKKLRAITTEPGVHSTSLAQSEEYILDTYQSASVPRKICLLNRKGKVLETLLEAPNPEKNYKTPHIEIGTIKADDGKTDLYYRIVKPHDFDPGKKYPVVVYVYGGPHAQLITNTWRYGAGGWDLYMAQQGYIVFTLDNRGSAGRGLAFEQVIHRQVGTVEMQDQVSGVQWLKSHSWVDADRIGVSGWSFGGFMTTNLMLTHPEIFKVGVAGGPVMDWSRYEVMYGERYNGHPEDNPEGYKRNNLTLRAGDLQGRLLLIHGVVDDVVVWQHAQAFVDACIKTRTYPDAMYYPTHLHNVSGPDRVHLHEVITRYFLDHL